ncbi:MAG: hypothetical protein WD226_09155 [Planctomycetota bacterium]
MKNWSHDDSMKRDELDTRIDEALQRQFQPPEKLSFTPRASAGGAGFRRPVVWAAALLVCTAGVLWWPSDAPLAPGVDPEGLAAEVARPERPNLIEIYEQIATFPDPVDDCRSGGASASVVRSLESRCGSSLELEPETARLLVGPFSSAEWPSGTMMAGYPDGPDEAPVVIVAECSDFQSCCIDLGAVGARGLQHFSTEHGGVVLTEITPHAEPRLLARLTARP